jgi:hypothetical protein
MGLFPKKIFCSLNKLISKILEISPRAYFRVYTVFIYLLTYKDHQKRQIMFDVHLSWYSSEILAVINIIFLYSLSSGIDLRYFLIKIDRSPN